MLLHANVGGERKSSSAGIWRACQSSHWIPSRNRWDSGERELETQTTGAMRVWEKQPRAGLCACLPISTRPASWHRGACGTWGDTASLLAQSFTLGTWSVLLLPLLFFLQKSSSVYDLALCWVYLVKKDKVINIQLLSSQVAWNTKLVVINLQPTKMAK